MTFTAFLFRDIHPDESLMVDAGENAGVVLNFYNSWANDFIKTRDVATYDKRKMFVRSQAER